MSDVLLETKNLTLQFGGLKAVDDLSFCLRKGQLAGLIGPNGAGKTTCFNMLTGVYQPTFGELFLNGQSLKGLKPHQISRRGVARTFQNIRLFKDLSVLDNVLVGKNQHVPYGLFSTLLQTSHFKKVEAEFIEQAHQLLKLFGLDHKANEEAGSLPYGEQRKLEIVRALATDPQIILLDEPAAGMNHSETHHLMELIARIRNEFKLTLLLIEHDMKLVMGICEHITVLDHGIKIEEGTPDHVKNSKKVIEAYLGVEGDL
jgi:branched-chain amino acid transport system ATP-binding protein